MSESDNLGGPTTVTPPAVEIFSTCPQSSLVPREHFFRIVAEVARWSEQFGWKGILVYTDNSLVDPWLVAQVIVQNTRALCPLVAVQPVYLHPYAVAKMVATFGHLYGRRVYLNMVAGGFKNDLAALNDTTAHDQRYARLVEYTTVIKQLLAGAGAVTFVGEFYQVKQLRMTPPLAPELFPGIFMSGSSEAGREAAQAVGATVIQYPRPARECPPPASVPWGVRVGVIARAREEEAWQVAEHRFPADRKGELTHQLAMRVSDSAWHKELAQVAAETRDRRGVYWLRPFETYKTFCPYLVGDYERVADELAKYIGVGYKTFVLDIPPDEEELRHTSIVFAKAARGAGG
jgi:alkanesulfonate monooxygenase